MPAETWHRFRARLQEIGLSEEYVSRIAKIGEGRIDPIGAPLQNWHARRVREPAAYAARMFMLADAVSVEDAGRALGPALLDALTEAGLILAAETGGVVSPFDLVAANNLHLICDNLNRGEGAVMGAMSTTGSLYQASLPGQPVQRMLDLGCGAGSCALLLAGHAATVVATDINPRAVVLAKVNAALNEISNVDFREGDLFAPVEGETFDLIVSQPPWLAQPAGVEERVYLFGGARGDEISLRILRELPAYLTSRGRAVLLVEWPLMEGEALEDRIAAAVTQDDCNVLLMKFPARDLDDYCTRYAALEHPEMGAEFARAAVERREHLEKMGIGGLMLTLVVIERNPDGLEWAGSMEIPALDTEFATRARIDKFVAARDLLAGDGAKLLATRLRVPEGTVFTREHRLGQPASTKMSARFPREALVGTIGLGPGAQLLLTLLHEAPDVESAIRRYAEGENLPFDTALGRLLPPLREAMLTGMLEPV